MINKRSKNVSKFIRCRAVWEFFSQTGCDLDNESFQSAQVKLEQRKLDLEKRYLWPLGKVIDLIKGKDEKIRVAKVLVKHKLNLVIMF